MAYPKGPRALPTVFNAARWDMTLYSRRSADAGNRRHGNAQRLSIANAPSILKIPVLPISHATRNISSRALMSRGIRPRGAARCRSDYHVAAVRRATHLAVEIRVGLKTSTMSSRRCRGVPIRSGVMRAIIMTDGCSAPADRMSGHIAMMARPRPSVRCEPGWRPKRTLVYLSWDPESRCMLGSTEWPKRMKPELKQKGLVYINSDGHDAAFSCRGQPFSSAICVTLSRPM